MASGHTRAGLHTYLTEENAWASGVNYTAPLTSAFAVHDGVPVAPNSAVSATASAPEDSLAPRSQPSLRPTALSNYFEVVDSTEATSPPSLSSSTAKVYKPAMVRFEIE